MVEHKKLKLLDNRENLFAANNSLGAKENIPIEKGVIINEDFLKLNEKLIQQYMDYFIQYPDVLTSSTL